MLNKSKLTKRIWVDGYAWKLEKVISPNKHDDFLLLSRKSETECHDDGTVPIYMTLVDTHAEEFYPDTVKVRVAMKEIRAEQKAAEERRQLGNPLTAAWLACFKDLE